MTVESIRQTASALFPGDAIYEGLDPVLAAHLKERVEADPRLRELLAVAAMGRAFGWSDDQ